MWQPGRSQQMMKQDIIFKTIKSHKMENQIKSNQMTEEQINQQLDFISKLAGGINDMAMDRIRYLLNIRYLDGQLEGINHAKKILS